MTRSSVPNYQGIGAPLRRVEDKRFLTGHGHFVADIELSGALACALVRSPHAHAAIRRIDASAALAAPGVVAVFTGADMAADGVVPMRSLWVVRSREGSPMAEPARFALARAGQVKDRGWLLDFVRAKKGFETGETTATPSLSHQKSPSIRLMNSFATPRPRLARESASTLASVAVAMIG